MSYNIFSIYNIFYYSYGFAFSYFCIGGLLFYLLPKIKEVNKIKVNIISIVSIFVSMILWCLLSIFISIKQNEVCNVVWHGYETIFTLVTTLSIFMLVYNNKIENDKSNKFFNFLSKNTLGIYFTHMLIIYATIYYVKKISFFCNVFTSTVYVLAICAVCLLISYIIKKIPLIRKIL